MKSRLSAIHASAALLLGASLLLSTAGYAGATTYSILHVFSGAPNDGSLPNGVFVDAGGRVFGTTDTGGSVEDKNRFYEGTFYELVPSGPSGKSYTEAFVHSFSCAVDGCYPKAAPFVDSRGHVYVTTPNSALGSNTEGTAVEFVPSGNMYRTRRILSFDGTNGNFPDAGFLQIGKTLYLTTQLGGSAGTGNVVALSADLQPTVLYDFKGCCADGRDPESALVADPSGALYGATEDGGIYGWGAVFRLTSSLSGATESILYSFRLGDGGYQPSGSLVIDGAGNLYGMTEGGGRFGLGTIFKLSPSHGFYIETVLHSFAGGFDGTSPTNSLVLVGSTLYGTTYNGGLAACDEGCGTIFSMSTSGSQYNVLHRFSGKDGIFPSAGLFAQNGALYGTTSEGPVSRSNVGYGLVFRLTP